MLVSSTSTSAVAAATTEPLSSSQQQESQNKMQNENFVEEQSKAKRTTSSIEKDNAQNNITKQVDIDSSKAPVRIKNNATDNCQSEASKQLSTLSERKNSIDHETDNKNRAATLNGRQASEEQPVAALLTSSIALSPLEDDVRRLGEGVLVSSVIKKKENKKEEESNGNDCSWLQPVEGQNLKLSKLKRQQQVELSHFDSMKRLADKETNIKVVDCTSERTMGAESAGRAESGCSKQENNLNNYSPTKTTCCSVISNKCPLSEFETEQVEEVLRKKQNSKEQLEQEQRMQQWTADAAAMVQQQRQQRNNNRDWHSNEESGSSPMPAARNNNNNTLLNMNLQLQRQVASQTRNNNNNNATSYSSRINPTTNISNNNKQNISFLDTEYFERRINKIITNNNNDDDIIISGQRATNDVVIANDEQSLSQQSLLKTADSGQQYNHFSCPIKTNISSLANVNEQVATSNTNNNNNSNNNNNIPMAKLNINNKLDIASSREPIPTPRNQLNVNNNNNNNNGTITDELTVLTNHLCLMNPRLKDLSCSSSSNNNNNNNNNIGSPNSILSDSTTLITEAAMNSSELIPKLIERLDRKLIVMKEEQLKLMREIEFNESSGQRLFCTMKKQLTVNEYEKILLHVNEIEKVTKLILSLKLRLKRVEAELKERNEREQEQHINEIKSNMNENNNKKSSSQTNNKKSSLRVQQNDTINISDSQLPATTILRGVSDPTSTTGLPIKRNHQHHASLQMPASTIDESPRPVLTTNHCRKRNDNNVVDYDEHRKSNEPNEEDDFNNHKLSLTNTQSSSGVSSRVCSPRNSSQFNHQQQSTDFTTTTTTTSAVSKSVSTAGVGAKTSGSSSNSSDSIFNCSDSAIGGSTIAGHGGSSTNIEEDNLHKTQANNISSQTSLISSTSSSSSNHRNQSHLCSNISVSSHSSISSSIPHSPPLTSPASISGGIGTSSSISGASTPVSSSSHSSGLIQQQQQQQLGLSNNDSRQQVTGNSKQSSTFFNNKSTTFISTTDNSNSSDSTAVHMLTDTDLLTAKRNKLISQLEEAHQLEDCIFKRNNIIIQRILKKYYDEGGQSGEIAEFKQFTRLKSLLLKDTHDVADRIDNAELQLTELKQSNPCNA